MLNVLDGLLTLTWMNMQVAEEANPLMAYLIDASPSLFLFTKILAVSLSCLILWYYRSCFVTRYIAFFAMLLYTGIIFFHVYGVIDANVITWKSISNMWDSFVAFIFTS